MKIRIGFISNSSSSSFCIKKSDITDFQAQLIKDHIEIACQYFKDIKWLDWPWEITEKTIEGEPYICGYTSMDNFDMDSFLQRIGISVNIDCHWDRD